MNLISIKQINQTNNSFNIINTNKKYATFLTFLCNCTFFTFLLLLLHSCCNMCPCDHVRLNDFLHTFLFFWTQNIFSCNQWCEARAGARPFYGSRSRSQPWEPAPLVSGAGSRQKRSCLFIPFSLIFSILRDCYNTFLENLN